VIGPGTRIIVSFTGGGVNKLALTSFSPVFPAPLLATLS
jgi:hypothetical protein